MPTLPSAIIAGLLRQTSMELAKLLYRLIQFHKIKQTVACEKPGKTWERLDYPPTIQKERGALERAPLAAFNLRPLEAPSRGCNVGSQGLLAVPIPGP
jgi:hypothetical protein